MPLQIKNPIEPFDCIDAELVIGLVCAVGTDYSPVCDSLEKTLQKFRYSTRRVRISALFQKLTECDLERSPETLRINSHMDAGNRGCRESGRKDLWALAAVAEINAAREKEEATGGPVLQKPLTAQHTSF